MNADARLLVNGHVVTMAPTPGGDVRRASAIALAGNRIAAVGDEDECRAAMPEGARESDLRGATVLPGFIDAHMHPVLTAVYDMEVDLRDATDHAWIAAALRRRLASTPAGRWLIGLRYDENSLRSSRKLDRTALDEMTGDRPTVVVQLDAHKVIGNTAAIRAAGIDGATPDPAGGRIERDATGAPDGAFYETASQLLLSAVPIPNPAEVVAAAQGTFARFASYGVTTFGAIVQAGREGPAGPAGALEAVVMTMLEASMPQNVSMLVIADSLDPILALRRGPLHVDDPGAGRRVAGLKIFSDGTLGSRTACMCRHYADDPATAGELVLDPEEIYARMALAHRAGLQIGIHAIGDEANRRCVELYRRLLREHPGSSHRHRIEHGSVLDDATIAAMAEMGVTVVAQPAFIRDERPFLPARLGPDRVGNVYAFRRMLDAGVVVAGSSDSPVDRYSALQGMTLAATRDGFETAQCVTPLQALAMYTTGAAWALGEETVAGILEAGKRADLVVLDGDPLAVAPTDIERLGVVETIARGKTIHGGI